MLFHRCSFILLTWFKNMKYFLLKGDANVSIKFCQLLVPENNSNALYWSLQHFWLESYYAFLFQMYNICISFQQNSITPLSAYYSYPSGIWKEWDERGGDAFSASYKKCASWSILSPWALFTFIISASNVHSVIEHTRA